MWDMALYRRINDCLRSMMPDPENDISQLRWKTSDLSVASCDELKNQWQALADDAREPNPFVDWYFVRSAAKHLNLQRGALIFQVWSGDRLVGVMVFASNWSVGRLPVPVMATLKHDYSFLGAPLIAGGFENNFASALVEWLDAKPKSALGIYFVDQASNGPFMRAMMARESKGERCYHRVHSFTRASQIFADRSASTSQSFSPKKKLRAKFRKLNDLGSVKFEVLSDQQFLSAWIDEFLLMEAQSWKSLGGTAVANNASHEAFFRNVLADAFTLGKLRFCRLSLDEKAIAYSFDLLHNREAFAIKIAHDRALDKYSPGVLLEQANLNDLVANKIVRSIDSCAAEDHPVLNGLWAERKEIVQYVVSGKSIIGRAWIGFIIWASDFSRVLRAKVSSFKRRQANEK